MTTDKSWLDRLRVISGDASLSVVDEDASSGRCGIAGDRRVLLRLRSLHVQGILSGLVETEILDVGIDPNLWTPRDHPAEDMPTRQLISSGQAAVNTLVCRREFISGLMSEARDAEAVLPSKGGQRDRCSVYITEFGGYFYFHSNFRSPGAPAATKIATRETRDLELLLFNVLCPTPETQQAFVHAHRFATTYLINPVVDIETLEPNGASRLLLL